MQALASLLLVDLFGGSPCKGIKPNDREKASGRQGFVLLRKVFERCQDFPSTGSAETFVRNEDSEEIKKHNVGSLTGTQGQVLKNRIDGILTSIGKEKTWIHQQMGRSKGPLCVTEICKLVTQHMRLGAYICDRESTIRDAICEEKKEGVPFFRMLVSR